MKNKLVFAGLLIAVLAMVLVIVPEVQAQTAAQQRELEQIAKRSMNGLSPQDRQRVVQIMTDVFVAQGMSRQQAAALAAQNADSMFTTDAGEMSAEERRMFEEQNRAVDDFEQRQAQQPQKMPGTAGWPAASVFSRYGKTLAKPNVQGFFSYEKTGDKLVIHLWKTVPIGIQGFTGTELQTVQNAVKSAFDSDDYTRGRFPDSQRKNTADMHYSIYFSMKTAGIGQTITITLEPGSQAIGGGR
jgi:hypothetical protein